MNIDDWKTQIKRGTLEFCILLMIRQKPSYGYEIISTLEHYPILAAKENTIYPLLRRSTRFCKSWTKRKGKRWRLSCWQPTGRGSMMCWITWNGCAFAMALR